MFVLCAYMCLCVGMYVCIENHTYVYIMHKELHGRVATEMLIVVLSERWISGNFYFFLRMLFGFFGNEYVQFISGRKSNRLLFVVERKNWTNA